MIIYVDIDGVLFTQDKKMPMAYELAKPIARNIAKINELYDQGHAIILWTARGGVSGIDWTEFTEKQLKKWSVKYHKLRMDKPPFDAFIDDKALDIEKLDPKDL